MLFWKDGFFDDRINTVPAGAKPVTQAMHDALMDAQATGAVIQTGSDGLPVAVVPQPTHDELIAQARAKIETATYNAIYNGFTYQGAAFCLTPDIQIAYSAMMSLAQAGQIQYPYTIRSNTGSLVFGGSGDIMAFCLAAAAYVHQCYQNDWSQKDSLASMTDDQLKAFINS